MINETETWSMKFGTGCQSFDPIQHLVIQHLNPVSNI